MSSSEATTRLLQLLAHPIRKSIVEALSTGIAAFSDVMWRIGLNPNFDTSIFTYHLHKLVKMHVVAKTDDRYSLTEFGTRLAELVSVLNRESSFLLEKKRKGGEIMLGDIETKWIFRELGKVKALRSERGYVFFFTGPESMLEGHPEREEDRKKLSATSQKLKNAVGFFALYSVGKVLGWLIVEPGMSMSSKTEKGEVGEIKEVRHTLNVKQVGIETTEDRKTVATRLIGDLLGEAGSLGLNGVEVTNVCAEDEDLVQALRESGFNRILSTYTMKKEL